MIEKFPISVVIPALNAAATLPATLRALGPVAELIVVDGGSTDRTADVARSFDAVTIQAPRGRGGQIVAGIAATTGDWILILHADTRLDPEWRAAATTHMRDHPDKAGWFRFVLDHPSATARLWERRVAWRCRVLGLPYGDQGLLVRRDVLTAVGGMRALPLMEDVDLIRRLGRSRLSSIAADAITSAAKWERDGWYRRSTRNLICLSLWFLGVPPRWIARLYG